MNRNKLLWRQHKKLQIKPQNKAQRLQVLKKISKTPTKWKKKNHQKNKYPTTNKVQNKKRRKSLSKLALLKKQENKQKNLLSANFFLTMKDPSTIH